MVMLRLILPLAFCVIALQYGSAQSRDRHGDPLPDGASARLGTVRLRSAGAALVVSTDSKTLLAVVGGRNLGRYDADTGRLLGETHLPGPFASDFWLAADGRTLAVPEAGKLVLWDTATGQRQHVLAVQPMHAAFAPNGRMLATAEYSKGKGAIRLWNVATGTWERLAELPSYANDLAFSPSGKLLFAAVDNHSLRCWEIASGRQVWQNDFWASRLLVAPDGRTICSATYLGGPLHLWDAHDGRKIASLGEGRPWTIGLAFSPDGKLLAQGLANEILLWDVAARKLRHRLVGAGPQVAFAPDGRSLFTLGRLVLRWDVASGRLLYIDTRAHGHVGRVTAVLFTPDGHSLISGGDDGTTRIWDLADGTYRLLPAARSIVDTDKGKPRWVEEKTGTLLALTPDGRRLLFDGGNGALALVELATGKVEQRFQLPKLENRYIMTAAVRITQDSRRLFAVGHSYSTGSTIVLEDEPQSVRAWDLETGKEVLSAKAPCSWVGGAFSPDGRFLALPRVRRIQHVQSERARPLTEVGAQNAHLWSPVAYSPDGHLVAAAETDGNALGLIRALRVYDAATGRQLYRVEAHLGYNPVPQFSPDSRLLAVSGVDALHVWDAVRGRQLLRLDARGRLSHWAADRFASCLVFAPDGKSLATGHGNGTILLWDLAAARKGLTGGLSAIDPAHGWEQLADADPAKAWTAIQRLARDPERATALLRKRVQPETVDRAWLSARLADLASSSFAKRAAATRELIRVVEAVESDLRRALARAETPEARRRIHDILDKLAERQAAIPPPEQLRKLRAVAVLERIGSDEARGVLRELAGGAPDAALTRAASAALERLARQAHAARSAPKLHRPGD